MTHPTTHHERKGLALLSLACNELGVQCSEVMGNGKHPRVVQVRSMVAHLLRENTSMGWKEIAARLGRHGSHAGIHEAAARCRARLSTDPAWAALVERVRAAVFGASVAPASSGVGGVGADQ